MIESIKKKALVKQNYDIEPNLLNEINRIEKDNKSLKIPNDIIIDKNDLEESMNSIKMRS